MARIKAALRLSDDPYRRERQRAYVAEREITVLREAGTVLWVSATESQFPRFAEQGIVAYRVDETETLRLPALAFDPADGDPEPPAELAAPHDHPHRLVLFAAPPAPGWLEQLTALGAAHVCDIPQQGAVFRDADAVSELDFVLWTGPYHPAYAVDFKLTTLGEPFTAVTLRELKIAAIPPRADGNLRVGIFDDADPDAVRAAVRATGATVLFTDGQALVLVADAAQVPAIARTPGIAALEPYSAPEPTLNYSRVIIGTDQVAQGRRTFLVNLDGAGEIAAVGDTGLDTGNVNAMHQDLAGRVIGLPGMIQKDDVDPGHGTHVAGIIAGNGAGSAIAGAPTVVGVAPAASVLPQRMNAPFIDNLVLAYRAGARVHNNSWRSTGVPTRNLYQATSLDLDRFAFSHPDLLVVFASGNDEEDALPQGGDGVLDQIALRGEQVAKNILCVGATESKRSDAGRPHRYRDYYPSRYNHGNFLLSAGGPMGVYSTSDDVDDVALFSNRGRVRRIGRGGERGRGVVPLPETGWTRPHLVAPGTNILSLRSSLSPLPAPNSTQAPPVNLPANLYRILTGTSMAAPHVTGAALLVRQYYRTLFRLLRRPRLLEEVPSGPPATSFVDLPAACSHVDGLALAWLTPVPAGAATRLVANRAAADLVPLNANPIPIGIDAGAPRLARHGEATLVLHRQQADGVRLRRLRRDLSPDPGFGTVPVTTAASTAAARPPALAVSGDRVAVAWAADGDGRLRFALFDAVTGTAVGTPADLGPAAQLPPHGGIVHNGTDFALVWVESVAGRHRLWFRRVGPSGQIVGNPVTLVDQAAPVRDPHLAWDPGRRRFLVVWCDESSHSGGEIRLRFLTVTGGAVGTDAVPVPVPAGRRVRRPCVAAHPVRGGVLAWEDDLHGEYDVQLTMLDATGTAHPGIPADQHDPLGRRVLRISDTALATAGFAATTTPDGSTVVLWQSSDEINSDRRGVYAVMVTADGTFLAQADPMTPLLRNGSYVNHTLETYPGFTPPFASVGACSAGGQRFLLRPIPQPGGLRGVELVRTSADGATAAAQPLAGTTEAALCSARWTGQRLIVATVARSFGRPSVRILDFHGHPILGLPARTLRGTVGGDSAPELGFVPGEDSRVLVGYQTGIGTAARIRLAVLDAALADTAAEDHNLVPELGPGHDVVTARHGWFHYVHEENLVLAGWTDEDQTGSRAWIARTRRIPLLGTWVRQQHAPVTTTPGDSRNLVLAPRPVGVLSPDAWQRVYLAAFQFRADVDAAPWEIRVSRVGRDGQVLPNLPAPAVPNRDVRVIFAGAVGWPAGTEAVEPQLACTYTDEPRVNPGTTATWSQWSPAFGLAFLGKPAAGGNRTLRFTLLDEYGRRVPDAAGTPSVILELTDTTADVLDFTLSWTGRYFWLTWVEKQGTDLRHRQTLVSRTGSRLAYDAPSAALLRATLLNGTAIPPTNPPTPLPNVDAGFGWGRLDLRQTLAPTPPVTFHVREDSVGPGGTLGYEFEVPSGTQLLRATLTWDDPPGGSIRNPITLHVVPPGRTVVEEYRGNVWNGAVSALVPVADPLPPVNDNVQQVRLRAPVPGRYRVFVRAGVFGQAPEQQFPAQAVAIVFVGSGREVPFSGFGNRNPPVL